MKKCIYFHINNDYSGSSYAMKAIIKCHNLNSFYLFSSFDNDGFLNKIDYKNAINIPYRFMGKNIFTIFHILRCIIYSLYNLFFSINFRKVEVVYINTILPFYAAIFGSLFNKKVIYHIHEYYESPSLLSKFYIFIMKHFADKLVFVSNFSRNKYLMRYPILKKINNSVEYTPVQFETINFNKNNLEQKFNGPIVMLCSPKKYKGIYNFIALAKIFEKRLFKLYLSQEYSFDFKLPKNIQIFVKYKDIENALFCASICLNLSQKPDWIETFGLTIWESLSQGTPVVVPNIGGPLEIIDEFCGVSCDTTNNEETLKAINKIIDNKSIYSKFSKKSIERSNYLNEMYKIKKI